MKQASKFEKIAARCWNLLNEGKPFTPIFILGTLLLFHVQSWGDLSFWQNGILALLLTVPLFILFFIYDFPLMLRNYLWIPFVVFVVLWPAIHIPLLFFAIGLYFFFTVFFWGTFYYHLRIGTSWMNFTRFWKLVLKNSDSTSGNAQEQLPKILLALSFWHMFYQSLTSANSFRVESLYGPSLFLLGFWLYTFILHRHLFDWKPEMYSTYTHENEKPGDGLSDKVVVIVIDGMRKERFYQANTPFLDKLRKGGTEYTQMETVYPARTVVCFTSMFTGTYPFEHGITSNMVWKLGIKVESIFDSLRKVGKKGRLLGIAHLVDSLGKDVDTVTAVMHNDLADRNIIDRSKKIMKEEDPDLFITQLIGTDQTGHSQGVFYDEYIQKIEEADKLIEEFVGWLDDEGKMKNTTLMICADHGQADGIGGHGHLDEGERFVPFFLWGPHIQSGQVIEDRESLVSVAPTLAHLLGTPFPSHSRGKILEKAFQQSSNEKREQHEENHRFFTGTQ
ncbi:alkaline phosphatase family protein [Pseudalkalibacillus berkeleyi]|uniref:Alkaline phosphatase family protein n=1 Tax=Pseudalkalibacillus berkeleyi TaxID=1069813 RepID=A0ABS9H2U9_9BACL|nr:alkaline phosphatase family protein [Pseudalkalibacillus berkeleyi]MCF6138155.1 alkaline phosphatase family protein [Pseudalkalibacillus berkeleyi]